MFFWNSFVFSMIQRMLAIWSLVPLPFLKPAWTSWSSRFTYCWSFTALCLYLNLWYFELNFTLLRLKVYFYILAYKCPSALASFIEKAIFPLVNCFITFVKNELGVLVWVYFSVLLYVLLTYVSVLLPVPQSCLL